MSILDNEGHDPNGLGNTRTVHDPFLNKDVQVSNRLTDRLRGKYANGPTMPNGEPEFGWREFQTPSIQHEAAAEIERLRAAIRWALGEAPDHNGHSFGDQAWEKAQPQPRYWWRTHLRALAGMGDGLVYDKERRTIVPRIDQQLSKTEPT